MTTFNVGDIVEYVYNPDITGTTIDFDKAIFKVLFVNTSYLRVECIDPKNNSLYIGQKETLKNNRFKLVRPEYTKEELIIEKIKHMDTRHKEFLKRKTNGTPSKKRTMSTVLPQW